MDEKLHIFEKVQKGSLRLKRLKHYLALYGVGFYLWIDYLWGLMLVQLKYVDDRMDNWIFRFFFDKSTLKIYPIVNFLNILGLIIFFIVTCYVIFWIYADTYCKKEKGIKVLPFKLQLLKSLFFNFSVYIILRVPVEIYMNFG
jgi:hypothetical protein